MSLEDDFNNHPIHHSLKSLDQQLKVAAKAPAWEDYSDVLSRLTSIAGLVRVSIESTPKNLLSFRLLQNITTELDRARNAIQQFIANPGTTNHVDQARDYMESVLQSCGAIPALATNKESAALLKAAEEYKSRSDELVAELKNSIDSSLESVKELENSAGSLDSKFDDLKEQLNNQKQRVEALVSQYQEDFGKAQTEQRAAFQEKLEELQEKLKAHEGEFIEDAKSALKELQDLNDQASRVVGLIGNKSVTGNYKITADNNADAANALRNGAAACFLAMAVLVIIIAFGVLDHDVPWEIAIFRLIGASIFAVPGYYLAGESKRHRDFSIRTRRIELELASLNPYLERLEGSIQEKIKEQLAARYFGNEYGESNEPHSSPAVPLNVLKTILSFLKTK